MKIIDILTSPWAIVPDKLFEIQEIYSTHLRGEKIDIKAIEAKLENPLNNETKPYQIIDRIAVIEIHGVIAKRMNLFSQISGGVSTQITGGDITEALNDPEVDGILLSIDSPGGSVEGTQELAGIIFEGREKKPILAYSDGIIASGAYWIGSAAHEMYISSDTVAVGSIGVVAAHVDMSKYEEKLGIKTTEVYAGKYKRISSAYQPLSEEGKQDIQGNVDYIYSVFVGQVAQHRGVPTENVIENMADGKLFIGQQSIKAGLVDGVSTFNQALLRVSAMSSEDKNINQQTAKEQKYMDITMETMAKDAPDLLVQIQADAEKTGHKTGIEEGTKIERERVTALLAIKDADLNSKEKAINEGLTVESSYKLFFEAEKTKKVEELKNLQSSVPDSVGQQGKEKDSDTEETFMAAVDEYQKENKCTRTEALQSVVKKRPALHEAALTGKEK